MDARELSMLLSPEGMRLLDSLPEYDSTADVVRTVTALRGEGHDADLVAAVLTQSRLRRRARAKFGEFADRMLFTQTGLEQATRLSVAALHASRFRNAGMTSVADLGCGIGGDALAMAAMGLTVTAVERDEVTAAIATYNLAPWPETVVELGDAESFDPERADGVFLDPARRAGTRRIADPSDWSPTLDTAFGFAERVPTGVKLAPGMDRALIPENAEAQWVSVNGETVEVGVWFGPLAREGVRRAALVITESADSRSSVELTGGTDSDDAPMGELGEFLFEPDGAVIRARLIGDLARSIDAHMVSDGIAWMTTNTPTDTPFASRFRVVETLPYDLKALKRLVRDRDLGTLEIKKRGIDVDPAALRAKLNPRGDNSGTLILTRVAGRRTAILAERL